MSTETTAIQIAPQEGQEVVPLRSLSLSQSIDASIALLTPECSLDVLQEQLLFVDSLTRIARDAHDRVYAAAAIWVIANGEFECNGVRYYVGPKKVTKCKDKAAVFDAMLVHCGGDMGTVCEFMASEPWKHGAIGKELPPEQFELLFEVTYVDELKEGKPKLQKVDQKFIR